MKIEDLPKLQTGYESPITLIQKEVEFKFENAILEAVHNIGVTVDKDELLKALTYDRDQYSKGYQQGLKENADALEEACEYIAKNDFCPFDRFGICKYGESECDNRETWRCWMEYFRGELE